MNMPPPCGARRPRRIRAFRRDICNLLLCDLVGLPQFDFAGDDPARQVAYLGVAQLDQQHIADLFKLISSLRRRRSSPGSRRSRMRFDRRRSGNATSIAGGCMSAIAIVASARAVVTTVGRLNPTFVLRMSAVDAREAPA